jgi:branched-chain amino acid transport system permease protein
LSGYLVTLATIIAINAIVASGLNVIVGFAGQISLGHAAFFGIGAYTAALLATQAGWTFWAALPCVIVLTAFVGLLLGIPSLRVREDFLAITTIGINFIVEAVFNNFEFFGGALGIGGIPRVAFFDLKLRGTEFLCLCLAFLAVVIALCWWLTRCWAGLACFALREEETAAASVGVSPVRFKLLAFVIGTAMAGLGGALYAHFMRFISAGDFAFPLSVSLLSMVVVGGIGTLWGPILGAILIGVLPEVFRPLIDYRILFYTTLLLLMIRFQPGGLLGENSAARRVLARILPGGRP